MVLHQSFSTRVPRNPWAPPVQSRDSATSYTNFILIIKLNAVFFIRQLNYCTGVPRVTGRYFRGSAPAKRLKTTVLHSILCCVNMRFCQQKSLKIFVRKNVYDFGTYFTDETRYSSNKYSKTFYKYASG